MLILEFGDMSGEKCSRKQIEVNDVSAAVLHIAFCRCHKAQSKSQPRALSYIIDDVNVCLFLQEQRHNVIEAVARAPHERRTTPLQSTHNRFLMKQNKITWHDLR